MKSTDNTLSPGDVSRLLYAPATPSTPAPSFEASERGQAPRYRHGARQAGPEFERPTTTRENHEALIVGLDKHLSEYERRVVSEVVNAALLPDGGAAIVSGGSSIRALTERRDLVLFGMMQAGKDDPADIVRTACAVYHSITGEPFQGFRR